MSSPSKRSLLEGFHRSCERFPTRPALEVGGQTLTYRQLQSRTEALARAILREERHPPNPLAAFLAYRSTAAYTAVLGILDSGKGYVPLNPHFPAARTAAMLSLSECTTLVVAAEGEAALHQVLLETKRSLTVLCLDAFDTAALSRQHPEHRFVTVDVDCDLMEWDRPVGTFEDATAYLMFTSGSTGVPKGVPVSHNNVTSYLNYVVPTYGFSPEDRFSQAFDMTFDLSVHDMFVCWSAGACLVAIPHATVMSPSKIIRGSALTVWFSVPSVIMFMQKLRSLRPQLFPNLRLSFFCGEPLLESWADAWQEAAPNSIVENLYGPTEATIAIARYRWRRRRDHNRCVNGVVPIGTVFEGQSAKIADAGGVALPRGEMGELWLAGNQVTRGYLNNPETTARQFVRSSEDSAVWYRTGDLVSEDEDGYMQYFGRADHQVQICGHRVELQEIDNAIRHVSGNDSAIAIAWPLEAGRADSVYAFLCASPGTDTASLIQKCGTVLPTYMVPRDIFLIDEMPINANGKIDRGALAGRLGQLVHDTP